MLPLLIRFARAVDWTTRQLGKLASWAVLLAALISAGNAFIRYGLDMSSNAWLEIQWYLFAATVMLGAPVVLSNVLVLHPVGGQPGEQAFPHALVGLHGQFEVFEHAVVFEDGRFLELAADAGVGAHVSESETSKGTVYRVRTGSYPNRAAANQALA